MSGRISKNYLQRHGRELNHLVCDKVLDQTDQRILAHGAHYDSVAAELTACIGNAICLVANLGMDGVRNAKTFQHLPCWRERRAGLLQMKRFAGPLAGVTGDMSRIRRLYVENVYLHILALHEYAHNVAYVMLRTG